MIKASDIISASAIGKMFAYESDNEQSAIINSMAAELIVSCRDKSTLENQICFISNKLDKNGKHLINELAEFLELRESVAT